MCTAALPVLVTTIGWFALVPTAMFPKLMLAGVADNCPVGAEEPVPVKGTVTVGLFGSLLVTAKLPVAAAAVVGANVRVACTDWPALRVAGVVMPLIPNSEPLKVITDTVRFALPVFERTKLEVLLDPTEIVPKLIEPGLTDNCG